MKPVNQTVFGKGTGNCFAACVATILHMKVEEVPNFCALYPAEDGTWFRKFIEWLRPMGLSPLSQQFPGDPDTFMNWVLSCAREVPWIGGGPTSRGDHCCVYVGDKLFHDPNPKAEPRGLDAVDSAIFLLCHDYKHARIDWRASFYADLAEQFGCTEMEAKVRWNTVIHSGPGIYGPAE